MLSIQDAEQLHGASPGVVVGAIDLVGPVAAGHLPCQRVVLLEGHVVGRVGDAGLVEQRLVVENHPEV